MSDTAAKTHDDSQEGKICAHASCNDAVALTRTTAMAGTQIGFCGSHDPLDDPAVSAFFEDVGGETE